MNVDVVARAVDVGRHLRVPALRAVAEMRARFQQLAHGKFWQSHGISLLYRLARREGYPLRGTPDGDERNTLRNPPARARWRAYRDLARPTQADLYRADQPCAGRLCATVEICANRDVRHEPHPPRHPQPRAQRHRPGRHAWRWAIPTSSRCGSARATWSRPTSSATPPSGRWTTARPSTPMRAASCRCARRSRDFHKRTVGADVALERITVPARRCWRWSRRCNALIETGDKSSSSRRSGPTSSRPRRCVGARGPLRAAGRGLARVAAALAARSRKAVRACDARTKAIFIASPGNPTGWMMTRDEQQARARIRAQARHRHHQRRGLWHAGL